VDGPYAVTASFGIATADSTTGDLDTLMSIADAALYRAKAEGRDRCIVSPREDVAVLDPGRRVLKAGQIVFNGGRSAINCTVRRLSEQGANLAVISTADVPNRFKLAIDADAFSKTCSVTHKSSGEIHVLFA
jgi:hypothetical protein